jgi:hypothetical protein
MSNAPEWVDEPENPEPERPPGEREQLIESIKHTNTLLVSAIAALRQNLLRLDEIGVPVTRSRSRADKIEAAREDWWAHFDYDVLKGMTKGTKDQQVRAERYELS